MGRYYSGDIEGKFWFAVQSSDDPSFFGGREDEPSFINYSFEKEDLKEVLAGLKICKEKLSKDKNDNFYIKVLDKFFDENKSYNDKQLSELPELEGKKIHSLLEWYARYELGVKIRDCIVENDGCYFEAEL